MHTVDINCDAGESFGAWKLGNDEQLFEHVTSVNVACGFHAGDPATMRATVAAAARRGLAIGAHPGLQDLAGFGRREMAVTPEEVYEMVVYQVGALSGFVRAQRSRLAHVKPHGALYNMAARDRGIARAIVGAVHDVSRELVVVGLSGSELLGEAERSGLRAISEVFADRSYDDDGQLTRRSTSGSLISDPDLAAERVVRMVTEGRVDSRNGVTVPVRAETICIHGDGPNAVAIAAAVSRRLRREGIRLAPPSSANA
jgi:5-oxoprolinase (ATP-hydrolysing) subunit A